MFFLKIIISALIIAAASELGKRSSFASAVLVSLPLTSLLTMVWIYVESKDNNAIAAFSKSVLVLVPLSLVFFVPFILQSKTHFSFQTNLFLSIVTTAIVYWGASALNLPFLK